MYSGLLMQNEVNFVPARRAVFVSPAIRRRFQGGRGLFVRPVFRPHRRAELGPTPFGRARLSGLYGIRRGFGPLEMAEESRFLVRSIARSRTFKPLWHTLLWPDSRAALRGRPVLNVN